MKNESKSKKLAFADLPTTYAGLVSLLPPRPLHDAVDYRNALTILDAMAGFEMNADQEDFFDAIATFVEKYEADRHPIDGPKMTPLKLIRSLMDEHGMNDSDLGRLLGDRSLTGQRELSKAHIRLLADYFSLNPAALL